MLWRVVKKLNMEVIVCLCVKGFPRVPTWFRQLFPYSDWGAALNARITPLFFSWLVGPCEVGWLSTPSSMLHCFFTWLLSHTVHKHTFKCVFVRTVANSSKSTYLQHSSLLQHDEDSIDCFFHLAMVLEWSAASQHHDLVFHFLKCNKKNSEHRFFYIFCPKFWADSQIPFKYTHCWGSWSSQWRVMGKLVTVPCHLWWGWWSSTSWHSPRMSFILSHVLFSIGRNWH